MCIGAGFNVASQLLTNGGDWRQIDLGEVAVAGLTGFFLPGAISAVREAVTTGSTRALIAAGAGIGTRGASSSASSQSAAFVYFLRSGKRIRRLCALPQRIISARSAWW
jgi:hypothetical protein